MSKSSTLLAASAAVISCLLCTSASAAFIEDGNYVRAQTSLSIGSGPAGGDTNTLATVTADSGVVETVNNAWSGSGRARASTSGSGLQVWSTSTAPDAGGLFPSSSTSRMTASWRDVLIPTMSGAPSELNFNFSVHAILEVDQTVDSGIFNGENISSADISVFANNSIISFPGTSSSQMTATVMNYDGGITTTSVIDGGGLNWNSTTFNLLSPNQYEFYGDFTYTASLISFAPSVPEAPFGAYFMGASMSTGAYNVGGTSMADAFSTMSLTSITTADGSMILADDFVFESGAAISAVPLPGSLLLMLSGLLGGFGLTRLGNTRE